MDNNLSNHFLSIKSYFDYALRLIAGGFFGLVFMTIFWMMSNDPKYYVKGLELIINNTTMAYVLVVCFIRIALFKKKERNFIIKKKKVFKKVIILPASFTFSVFMLITFVLFSIFKWIN